MMRSNTQAGFVQCRGTREIRFFGVGAASVGHLLVFNVSPCQKRGDPSQCEPLGGQRFPELFPNRMSGHRNDCVPVCAPRSRLLKLVRGGYPSVGLDMFSSCFLWKFGRWGGAASRASAAPQARRHGLAPSAAVGVTFRKTVLLCGRRLGGSLGHGPPATRIVATKLLGQDEIWPLDVPQCEPLRGQRFSELFPLACLDPGATLCRLGRPAAGSLIFFVEGIHLWTLTCIRVHFHGCVGAGLGR